uniref:Peptidase S1 domain-containing protein n=1 Tax=Panagrolaimus sp. PS1159 TaxID=55785 RepID=A0AC35GMQ2_9BILA
MSAEKLILFFAVFFLLQQNVYGFNGDRIVNGTPTPDGVFEFLPRLSMLHLLKSGGILLGRCSSTIISPRHVLTAAHCIFARFPNAATVFGKKINRVPAVLIHYRPKEKVVEEENGWKVFLDLQNYAIAPKVYVHPSYHTSIYYDIAIIEFPIGTNINITPITLASDYAEKEGDMAIAAGYGIYKNEPDPVDPNKEITDIPIVLQNTTVPVRINFPDAPPTVIITSKYETYAYSGDSGGPLMIDRNGKIFQIGVASTTMVNHTAQDAFNTYTRVSLHCDWISNMTKGEAKCQPLPNDPNVKPPVNPPVPAPIDPNRPIQPATKRPSNVNDSTTLLPGTPQALKKSAENSSIGFTLNVLLFAFIGIFYFA